VAKAAKAEAPESEAIEPASAPTPRVVSRPPPDPNEPIDCSALVLSHAYGVNKTDSMIRVDMGVSTGIEVHGLCEKIQLFPNGTYVVHVRMGVAKHISAAERARYPLRYLVFRHGYGEVAT
jgi:hypothetical protein